MTFGSSFWKKKVSVSTYFDVFSNLIYITMIAEVCDRESRRDSWFENRLILIVRFNSFGGRGGYSLNVNEGEFPLVQGGRTTCF